MSKFPWKSVVVLAAILTATTYAIAQVSLMNGPMGEHGQMRHGDMAAGGSGGMADMHRQMMQSNRSMHSGMDRSDAAAPVLPGQDAFGAIQEIVHILEADPATDWSRVDISALREHLIDMNEVTLHASVSERVTGEGVEFVATGEGRTLQAIKRMVLAHVHELQTLGWNARAEELPNGEKLTVTTSDALTRVRLKALGFIGVMVQGAHHRAHHLMMAKGELNH